MFTRESMAPGSRLRMISVAISNAEIACHRMSCRDENLLVHDVHGPDGLKEWNDVVLPDEGNVQQTGLLESWSSRSGPGAQQLIRCPIPD